MLFAIALFATIRFNIGPFKLHLAEQGIFDFPYIWHFNTYVAAILKFFLLLVILLIFFFSPGKPGKATGSWHHPEWPFGEIPHYVF